MEELPKINILYEDNHLLVVEKPINIPVQADDSQDDDLLSILKKYRKINENKKGNVYLGLVHRLDRPVGGIMVFAKTSKAASRLSEQIKNNLFKKTYLAIIEGKIDDHGTLRDYLTKDNKLNKSYVTNKESGKLSILDYEVIGKIDNLCLVKINLVTGRSHQIRVQFSNIGCPLIGDNKYGNNKKCDLALFAYELSFYHPITKEQLKYSLNLPNKYPFSLFKKDTK